MKKYLYLLIVIVTFSACHRNDFTVTGNVSDAEGKTLYFEATQIDKIVTLDSIKLKSDGKFTFYAPKTEFPEFYRLRLDSSYIHFAIDSTETVAFHTSGKSFTDYSVEGSEENKQIQEVSKAGSLLKNEVDKILSNTGTSDSIPAMLSNGEAVMTAQAVNDWGAMLSAMNVASGGNAIQVSNLPQRNDGMKGMERMMERALMNMPAPIVSVVDINKGQKRVKVQNSLGKLGRKKYE